MTGRLAAGALLALVLATPIASASHAPGTLPLRVGDAPVDGMLDWLADRVDDDGCVRRDGACRTGLTKWVALSLPHAGVDPARWPAPDRSVHGWLLAHADDLRDAEARRCDGTVADPSTCMARNVYSLSKSILALDGAGQDPRQVPLPDGGRRDLVAELLQNRTADQFGSPEHVNDDIWALVALNAADHSGPAVQDAVDEIEDAQTADGGVPWSRTAAPDADTTAAAVIALAPHDRPASVDAAVGFLADSQVQDGQARGCFAARPGQAATAGSTAWAIQALVAADRDPWTWQVDDQGPTRCLAGFRTATGGLANSRQAGQTGTSYQATYQGLAGLSWTPYGVPDGPVEPIRRVREMDRDGIEISLTDATFRLDDRTHDRVELAYDAPRPPVVHGFTFSPDPRPVTVRVEPSIPTAPTIDAPRRVPHGQPVQITLAPGGDGTSSLALGLPNGTELAGPDHTLTLDAPGEVTLTAHGVNGIGETGPTTRHRIEATNRAPAIDGIDATVSASGNATVRADVDDPDGDPVEVRWRVGGRVVAEGANATVRLPASGPVVVGAVAEDPWGAEATETTVLHVPAPRQEPVDDDPSEPDDPVTTDPDDPVRPAGGRSRAVPAASAGLVVCAVVAVWGWRRWR